jgi:hypothetical protein
MLIMAGRKRKCRAQTLIVRSCFLSLSQISGERDFRIYLDAWQVTTSRREVSVDPSSDQLREKYPRYQEYFAAIFAGVNEKPRIVEEHDGWAGVFSSERLSGR